MSQMLIEVVIDDQPMECAVFGLFELAAAHQWTQEKVEFYKPVNVDVVVTIGDKSVVIPEYLAPEVG